MLPTMRQRGHPRRRAGGITICPTSSNYHRKSQRRTETGVWWASTVRRRPPRTSFRPSSDLLHHPRADPARRDGRRHSLARRRQLRLRLALSKGQLPYNDFVLTQPPGMSILLLPFAWGAHIERAGALGAARALTAPSDLLGLTFLAALTARFHGVAARHHRRRDVRHLPQDSSTPPHGDAGALSPVLLPAGPPCRLHEGQLAERRPPRPGGSLVGFAVTIKPWAIVPAAALLVCAAVSGVSPPSCGCSAASSRCRRSPHIFVLAAAGSSFVHDVLTGELNTGRALAPPPASPPTTVWPSCSASEPARLPTRAASPRRRPRLIVLVADAAIASRMRPRPQCSIGCCMATASGSWPVSPSSRTTTTQSTTSTILAGFGAIVVGNPSAPCCR